MQVRLRTKRNTFKIGLVFALSLIIAGVFLLPKVRAGVECGGKCSNCEPYATGSTFGCNRTDPGSFKECCFDKKCNGNCSSAKKPSCGNCKWFCDQQSCSCTPVTCKDQPGSKWRKNPVPNGQYRTCNGDNDCNPQVGNCAPKYVNSAPTCSISPATLTGTRGSGGSTFTLTVNDADYGDEVRITGFNVKDTAGNLNNCVTIQTIGGGAGLGATVKQGYPDSNPLTSQTNTFVANPDLMHGIYQKVNGKSLCSGTLTVEIRDVEGDSLDTTSYATCSVKIEMQNNAPTISDIKVTDQDDMPSLRKPGNLISGNPVFIGSISTAKRASFCSSGFTTTTPGICNESNKVPLLSRSNPFTVEYTVNDADGVKDIMQSGIWIQRADKGANTRTLPPVSNNVRNNLQVLYAEKENFQTTSGKWYYNSRACVGDTCTPNSMIGSPKLAFLAYNIIANKDKIIPITANASKSPYKYSTFRQWQATGFPDCFLTVAGCTDANVPTASKSGADFVLNQFENYDWIVQADSSSLVCYKNDAIAPEVLLDTDKCLPGCAACAAKMGVEQVSNTQAVFKYKIYFNDRDDSTGNSSGMDAGEYKIFVSALDKVGVPLQNATGLGDEAWLKFDKNGVICPTGTCAAGDFSLVYDPIAPSVTNISPSISNDSVSVSMTYSDNNGGSKIAGESMGYMLKETLVNGEPLDRSWLKKTDGVTDYDGSNEHASIAGSPGTITVTRYGKGAVSGDNIIVGSCAYDNAGNMGCGKIGSNYVYISSWLKTSLGDIYSNTSSSSTAFKNLTVPNTEDRSTLGESFLPYRDTANSVATGILASGGGVGIAGGRRFGSLDYPLGFSTSTSSQSNYRTTDTNLFNMLNFQSSIVGNEYERLKALASRNCELLSTDCKTSGSISDVSAAAKYKIITLTGSQTISSELLCTNANVIFVSGGTITITGQVRKSNANSGCLFALGNGSKLVIGDVASDTGVTEPAIDRFEAAVVAGPGATVEVAKGQRGATTKRFDRLEVYGFIYSSNTAPVFNRVLLSGDNKHYPAEWIVYDTNALELFRPILGFNKTVDLVCGTSNHLLCDDK